MFSNSWNGLQNAENLTQTLRTAAVYLALNSKAGTVSTGLATSCCLTPVTLPQILSGAWVLPIPMTRTTSGIRPVGEEAIWDACIPHWRAWITVPASLLIPVSDKHVWWEGADGSSSSRVLDFLHERLRSDSKLTASACYAYMGSKTKLGALSLLLLPLLTLLGILSLSSPPPFSHSFPPSSPSPSHPGFFASQIIKKLNEK